MFKIELNFTPSAWMYTVIDPKQLLRVIASWDKEAAARVANFWGELPTTLEGDDEIIIRKMKNEAFEHIQKQTFFELCDVCDWALIDTDENVHDGWCAEQAAREEEAFEDLVEDEIIDEDDHECPRCGHDNCVCIDEQDLCACGEPTGVTCVCAEMVSYRAHQANPDTRGSYWTP